jgi:hypothetical protein
MLPTTRLSFSKKEYGAGKAAREVKRPKKVVDRKKK